MVHIKIKKGLDIPIEGKPKGNGGEVSQLPHPAQIGLDLSPFEDLKLRLLVKPGDIVKIGQPLVEDKGAPGRMIVSPGGGTVKDIRRGEKRVLQAIVIDTAHPEEHLSYPSLLPGQTGRDQLIERLKEAGIFANIRTRPFDILVDPAKMPRSIFVKAIESAPFMPPSELQIRGHEKEFQIGLDALAKMTDGPVHLVYSKDSTFKAFTEAKNVQHHTAEGPHPIGNYAVHIRNIDRIRSPADIIWTLNAHDVMAIGHLLHHGRCYIERIISIAGSGILPDKVGYFKARTGYPIGGLIAGRIPKGSLRFISGDPLMGRKVYADDFLGYNDYVFCVFPENHAREFLHFFRLGADKYSFSRAYASGHLKNKEYPFTTNQHGEKRAFIDSTLYDKVMPLDVPTMHLVKAVMAEDYDLAEELGLLEVDPELFALPSFVDPSKIEMSEIIKRGLKQYAKESLE
jgi:Na+-transporting NADH:ubiquinone oxidoreductase subunit A